MRGKTRAGVGCSLVPSRGLRCSGMLPARDFIQINIQVDIHCYTSHTCKGRITFIFHSKYWPDELCTLVPRQANLSCLSDKQDILSTSDKIQEDRIDEIDDSQRKR